MIRLILHSPGLIEVMGENDESFQPCLRDIVKTIIIGINPPMALKIKQLSIINLSSGNQVKIPEVNYLRMTCGA
jgi:hypothetical protein